MRPLLTALSSLVSLGAACLALSSCTAGVSKGEGEGGFIDGPDSGPTFDGEARDRYQEVVARCDLFRVRLANLPACGVGRNQDSVVPGSRCEIQYHPSDLDLQHPDPQVRQEAFDLFNEIYEDPICSLQNIWTVDLLDGTGPVDCEAFSVTTSNQTFILSFISIDPGSEPPIPGCETLTPEEANDLLP